MNQDTSEEIDDDNAVNDSKANPTDETITNLDKDIDELLECLENVPESDSDESDSDESDSENDDSEDSDSSSNDSFTEAPPKADLDNLFG